MRAFRYTTHIARPPDEVWAFITDFAAAPRWRPLVKFMGVADGGPTRAGARLRVTIVLGGRETTREVELAAVEPPRRLMTRSGSSGIEGTFEYLVEPEGGGTRVTHTCHLWASRLLMWPAVPLLVPSQRRVHGQALPNLKRAMEGGGASGH